jgi:hypothetical protein|uniref:Uncharacterized protein n=1 Tax=Poterioochromonas malhamensis TaxID=88167 RepID=A0A7T6Y8F9_9STRA|nr:hypothetical protein KYW67_pgp126 [Poterioochromonas malhamensis]YP_010139408.1 hypothetical protein KYW67_pgp019 [Poterioochromonas malhamensis]QQK54967.1 hypothetical protein [Poterioochromonas malhamensis]QQK55074.1 hypothetical protein [Poterioochromonas malhamensis]
MKPYIFLIKLGNEVFVVLKKNKGLFFLSLFSFYKLLNFPNLTQMAQQYDENYPLIGAIFKALYQEEKVMYPTPSKEQMATSALRATEFANAVRFMELRDKSLLAFSNASFFKKVSVLFSFFDLHPKAFFLKKCFQFLLFSYFAIKLAKNISNYYSKNKKQ